jgi:hypothetical protein
MYLAILWKNWNFTPKSVGFLAALMLFQKLTLHFPNYLNETIAQSNRRNLAR